MAVLPIGMLLPQVNGVSEFGHGREMARIALGSAAPEFDK